MSNKTDEEIKITKEKATKLLQEKGFEVVDTYLEGEWYDAQNMINRGFFQIPLYYLSKSLENMSLCNAVYFCNGWTENRGCKIEHEAARVYGLEVIYEE